MSDSTQTIRCCEMFNCYEEGWRSFSLAPGTYLLLCKDHYLKEAKEKFGLEYELDDDTER
jgi:hypothetical protein